MKNKRIAYVLGAGASCHTGLPLSSNFLKFIYDKYIYEQKRELPGLTLSVNYFKKLFKRKPTLEDLLSFIDKNIDVRTPIIYDDISSEGAIYEEIIDYIKRVIKDSTPESDELSKKFVSKLSINDTIISFNYDLLIDRALFFMDGLSYGIKIKPIESYFFNKNNDLIKKLNKGILLLKPHGSLSFLYSPQEDNLYIDISQIKKNLETKLCLPLGINYPRTLIIPPSKKKSSNNRYLNKIWKKTQESLDNSDKVIFIGYSLSPMDEESIRVFDESINKSKKRKEIIVVGLDKYNLKKNYGSLFKKFDIISDNFSNYIKRDIK